MTPEARARQHIDALLTAAGWVVCAVSNVNLNAGTGTARGVAATCPSSAKSKPR